MSNSNVLAGVKCPRCGNEDDFVVTFNVRAGGVLVTDDGYDLSEATSIDDDLYGPESVWTCNDCALTRTGGLR